MYNILSIYIKLILIDYTIIYYENDNTIFIVYVLFYFFRERNLSFYIYKI